MRFRRNRKAPSTGITEDQTIWYPGIYNGRQGDYATPLSNVSEKELIRLVQQRAQEDGQWAIDNNFVGDNEDQMRKMMAWVSREENIRQCYHYIYRRGMLGERTVDWVCRDLANGSKWLGGSRS